MNITNHDLFHRNFYSQSQTQFVDDLIIRDWKEQSININSMQQIDNVLNFLENSIISTTLFNDSNELLAVPSAEILSILFTLASRYTNNNYMMASSSIANKLGVSQTEEQIRSNMRISDANLMNAAFHQRACLLIKAYNELIIEQRHLRLYNNFLQFMNKFIVDQTVSGFEKKTRPTSRHQTSSPEKKPRKDIFSMIRESPRKKDVQKRKYQSNTEIDENGEECIIISDSEEDQEVLQNPVNLEAEIAKYESVKLSTESKVPDEIGLNSAAFMSQESTRIKEQPSIKVFDEDLISDRLNPKKSDFNLWKLINWTFYCSGLLNDQYNSSYKSSHLIFETQFGNINEIFKFLEYNYVSEVAQLYSEPEFYTELFNMSQKRRKLAVNQIESSSSILFSRIMKHLGIYKKNWYDRIVEYVFNGLLYKRNICPQSCYEYEKILLKKDENLKREDRISKTIYYNENMSSMKLRFRITCLVYFWSLIYDNNTKDGIIDHSVEEDNYLAPRNLINQLRNKFLYIEYDYLIEFYSSMNLKSKIPKAYRVAFLINISMGLLKAITERSEFNQPLETRINSEDSSDDSWKIKNLYKVLSWISVDDISNTLLEDETYTTFGHFDQIWSKYNYILNWLFEIFLVEASNLRNKLDLTNLMLIAEQVDSSRRSKYLKFVDQCYHNQCYLKITADQYYKYSDLSRSKFDSLTTIIQAIF